MEVPAYRDAQRKGVTCLERYRISARSLTRQPGQRYLRALTELTGLRIRSKREKVLERFPEDLVYRHSKGVAESRDRR